MTEQPTTLSKRVDEIEIKMTLLEQASEDMNQVIIAQQTSIASLTRKLDQAKMHMQRLGEQIDNDDSPPPHY